VTPVKNGGITLSSLGISADKPFVPATTIEKQSGHDSLERRESFLRSIQGLRG